jgi:replicative DNA helicase
MKELEKSLLGTILKAEINDGCNALLNEAKESGINADFFTAHGTRTMWETMCKLDSKGVILGTMSLFTDMSKGQKGLDASSVWSTHDAGLSELHFKGLTDDMVESYKSRNLHRLSLIIKDGLQEGKDSEEILTSIQGQCDSIASLTPTRDTLQTIVDQTFKDVTGKVDYSRYLRTGIQSIDDVLYRNGYGSGQLCVLASRPGCGKTAYALNFLKNVCTTGNGVLLFNLEMGANQIMKRIFSIKSGLHMRRFEDGLAPEDKMQTLRETTETVKGWNCWIRDNVYQLDHILATARGMHRKHNVNGIIIDYCQLIKPMSKNISREQQVAEISRELKLLAKDLDIPVLLLAQVNRESERDDRSPIMSDLRESGALEQDADSIIFLWQTLSEREQGTDYVRWTLAKQREGIGYTQGRILFNKGTQQMEDYSQFI